MKYKLFGILIVFLLFSCERSKPNNPATFVMPGSAETREIEIEQTHELDDLIKLTSDYYKSMPYGMAFDDIDLSSFDFPDKDYSFISLQNCRIVTDYSVPYIINVPTGMSDGELPFSLVTVSYFYRTWYGFLVILKRDIDTDKKISLIAKGGSNEYEYKGEIQLEKVTDYLDHDTIFGYYFEVYFENKPWLNNSANKNNWQIIVKSGDEILIDEEQVFNFSYLFFDKHDESPFAVNNLRRASLNKDYTYRFKTQDADLLTLFLAFDLPDPLYGTIYRPVLYLIPNDNGSEFTDIKISWNDEQLKGSYHFGRHKINNLPTEEFMLPVFDYILVR